MDAQTQKNAAAIELELDWLALVLDLRLRLIFETFEPPVDPLELPPPEHEAGSAFAELLARQDFGAPERVALALALAAELRPQLFDVFAIKNSATGRRFTEFGGTSTSGGEGFLPTGATLAFVLDGGSALSRLFVRRLFDPDHPFCVEELLASEGEGKRPILDLPLRVPADTLARLGTGHLPPPRLGVDFPAQRIETSLSWDDLVLHPATRRQVGEIQTWLEHGQTLLDDWAMAGKLRPGHRALFYGPPGTGKSMTACLLGKSTGRDVYRVDLSLTVSKYIGETEKNLAKVFDRAQRRGWLLFFDEAEALFGKRSDTRDAHDRYANQEVAYLLQRIESFDGVVILASNLRENLDDAFTRRFESVIYFPLPRADERQHLWTQGFPARASLGADVDLAAVARDHELAGGAIMNVIRHLCLESLAEGGRPIDAQGLERAIRRELAKEGRGL
ncbi:ATP-binding protein [Pseudenhygromyxa sp. WMMC2535]|uniref:ATP-binding protein n=1 Tax=Pseudenhygromyxa sp. WMMC2535 TaxID=2712867 RepID=UPI0015561AF7|nr:ATP-binding protein [Pseudenhygromyxa sp. WMMC2535]NVB43294.1 ATP-binding protein [Pseudenhygromyxa sp. WMMC2535]